MLPWVLCATLTIVVIALSIKIFFMRKGIKEICASLSKHLSADTNQLIYLSTSDKHVRRLANELSKQLSALRRLQRQYISGDNELKEAVTNISHDLRTPLTAICGYLDLIKKQELPENVRRYTEHISNRTEAMKGLTEELFRYSVICSTPSLSEEQVNICGALEESLVSFYAEMTKRNIDPIIELPSAPVFRKLDPSALSRIFGNIIGNAVKYSDGDLSVVMSDDACITFSNTAKALSAVDVGKLFDRFYTVDSARSSSGLGLSIAKLLVERMNGSIYAEFINSKLVITVKF